MDHSIKTNKLIVPVYINEKIVFDMLATIEDGFSMVSQVNYTEHKESNSIQKAEAGLSTSATILSKLLKINVSGELNHSGNKGEKESVSTEKIHTNPELFTAIDSQKKSALTCFYHDISEEKLKPLSTKGRKNPLGYQLACFWDCQSSPVTGFIYSS